ncbi:unnamed protein product [Euphydryas editha]|uniref:Reverse transcriptase domain-containing protein n=1 Tax=Euphydryas editha TaxID=104508 RepID=A0AAU9U0D3_EUPED|nr:unnamed protein product [Euphydryas editha]
MVELKEAIGNDGHGDRNDRGQRLINYAFENKLSIINTYFKKKSSRRWTWRSPSGIYKNEIDYILSNQPKLFLNIETLNLNFSTDHRMLRATITPKVAKKSRVTFTNKQNNTLKTTEEIEAYKKNLRHQISNLAKYQMETSVQDFYNKLLHIINVSLQQARQVKNTSIRHKILSERTIALLNRRQILQKSKDKTISEKNELRALYKLTSKYIKNDYKNYRNQKIQTYLTQGKSFKKAIKELRTNKTWIEGLSQSGQTTHNRREIILIATEFFKNLYSANTQQTNNNKQEAYNIYENVENNMNYIDELEIIHAVNKLKLEKSPGPDFITNEAIKYGCEILASPLSALFNLILKTANTPTQWSESIIILLYKKGNPNDISNYRPISLLPTIYKLFSSIINRRISETLEKRQPIEQAGFRKGYSTIDHIYTLELIIEKYQENRRPLYLAFIDYQKAFDTISHTSIWEALSEQGVEKEYIQVIKNIYKNSVSKVKLESTGPDFNINRGVRQGDPLSPKLFIAVLESIINKLDWNKYGLYIKGEYLSHLRFADDLVLLSETSENLERMIQSLHEASIQVGLKINLTKTNTMTNSYKRTISLEHKPLQYVEQYIYLGKQITLDSNSNELEVERRTRITWNKFWCYKEVMKSNMPTDMKRKMMDTCILPCLTYACQTWKFTNNIKNKIITCQRGMERSMLNIRKTHRIRHTKIRNITQTIDALHHAQRLKFKWAGHVARLKDKRWTSKVATWDGPQGKRRVGRPCMRWEDDIKKIAGPDWIHIAKDREKWKSLEEAFT